MDVHEELALDVFTREAAEVDFIEDDAGGLVDAEESHEERDECDGAEHLPVSRGEIEDVIVLHALRCVFVAGVGWFVG